jgi:hypothetical protein
MSIKYTLKEKFRKTERKRFFSFLGARCLEKKERRENIKNRKL